MGWSTYHRAPGETDREHFQKELRKGVEIIDCTTVKNVFYAAAKEGDEVYALVFLIHRSRGYYNFGVKTMDETVGPGSYDCPDRILDLLTPTDSKWANEWREECRKQNKAKAEARAKAKDNKVTDGSTIRLANPLNFQGGHTAQEFRLRVDGRRRRWVGNPGTDDQFLCRLPRDWATLYQWEKIAA